VRAFLVRRLVHALFVVWGVVTVVFFLVRLTGDPAALLVDATATREEVARTRQMLGLDRPLYVQYLDFLRTAPRGDFGLSIRERRPAMRMVLEHFWPATAQLAFAAIVLSVVLPIPLGVVAATHRNGVVDHASRLGSLFLQSMPSFWLGLMLILLFAVALGGLLPAYGWGTLSHLILPALTLAAAPLAQNVRLVRAGMLEVRNAAGPFLTVSGLSLGFMLSGTIVIETVFSWPGMGRLIVQAVPGRDFPVIQAAVFLFAILFVAVNLVVDVAQGLLDPRARVFEDAA